MAKNGCRQHERGIYSQGQISQGSLSPHKTFGGMNDLTVKGMVLCLLEQL